MNYNKKSAIISAIITIIGISSSVYASNKVEAAQDAYQQLVVNEQDTATVYVDDDTKTTDIIEELILMDNETPYDAEMALYRAPSYSITRYKSGNLTITLNNAFNINEADKLLNDMEQDIKNNLPEQYSQKDALEEIIRYISHTYSYELAARENDSNDNFVKAYNTDKKIICAQYSALTYLLCNRFGIDAKIIAGNDHAYNAIRLDSENQYTAYDLTKTTYKFLPAKVSFTDLITGTYSLALESNEMANSNGQVLNNRIHFHYSFTYQDAVAIVFVIGIITLLIAALKHRNKRTSKAIRR